MTHVPPVLSAEDRTTLTRWRLLLGKGAEKKGIGVGAAGVGAAGEDAAGVGATTEGAAGEDATSAGAAGEDAAGEEAAGEEAAGEVCSTLDALFGKSGGLGRSKLNVVTWVDRVTELFPRSSKEVLQRELLRRRGIDEWIESPEIFDKIEPDLELATTLLANKDLFSPRTRGLVRTLIDRVVTEVRRKLEVSVESAITGALRRDKHSPRRVFRNLDLKTTIRRNLKNWDDDRGKLLVDKITYFSAEHARRPWHIIVCVDQSGSMLESALFSSVMASIFAELPGLSTSLVLFDTSVVDLTDQVGQPVDVLLSIQLGGGTLIANALDYCFTLLREPAQTILVLITDFYEGGPHADLLRATAQLTEAKVRVIGLPALGYRDAKPDYCKQTAAKLMKVGMDLLICTPDKLAEAIGEVIRR